MIIYSPLGELAFLLWGILRGWLCWRNRPEKNIKWMKGCLMSMINDKVADKAIFYVEKWAPTLRRGLTGGWIQASVTVEPALNGISALIIPSTKPLKCKMMGMRIVWCGWMTMVFLFQRSWTCWKDDSSTWRGEQQECLQWSKTPPVGLKTLWRKKLGWVWWINLNGEKTFPV